MDELILKVLRGHASEIEERQVRKWRESAAENERHYRVMAGIWDLTDGKERPGAGPPPGTAAAVVRAVESRRVAAGRGRVWRRRSVLWGISAAAAVVLLWVGSTLWPDAGSDRLAAVEFSADGGESVSVTLNDGSFVRLAPGSRIRVADRTRRRDVWLHGRAFFAVTPDDQRPFTVSTDAGAATVLGTRFEIRSTPDELRVVVLEGRVAVSADGHRVEVAEHEVSEVRPGLPPSVRPVEDVAELLDWPSGILTFRNTPLARAVDEVSKFFGRAVELSEGVAAERRVTASFTTETFTDVLTTVCVVADVRCLVGDSVSVIAERQ